MSTCQVTFSGIICQAYQHLSEEHDSAEPLQTSVTEEMKTYILRMLQDYPNVKPMTIFKTLTALHEQGAFGADLMPTKIQLRNALTYLRSRKLKLSIKPWIKAPNPNQGQRRSSFVQPITTGAIRLPLSLAFSSFFSSSSLSSLVNHPRITMKEEKRHVKSGSGRGTYARQACNHCRRRQVLSVVVRFLSAFPSRLTVALGAMSQTQGAVEC